MFRISIVLLLATFSCVSPSMGRGIVIEDIEDAGIYCVIDGVRGFYDLAVKRCKGKTFCTMAATMVATRQELIKKQCTGFFVAPVCQGTPVNVESRYDVFKALQISCKR